nr:RDD family protein [Tessaracoccus coleopterorum]
MIPRGVVVAGLGRRFLAAVIDLLPIALAYAALFIVLNATSSPAIMLVASIGAAVVIAGYALYQWWAYATRGAGIGARFTGLRLVSLSNGEPIGWWRFFLRQLVFSALMGTVIGGIALLIFLVIHERRQGWHDMVAGAVVVQPKVAEVKPQTQQKKTHATSTVGLPPHLASTFSPQPGTSQGWSSEPQAAPDWLPGVASEPLQPQNPFQPPQAQPAQPAGQAPWSPPQAAPATQAWPAPAQQPQPWQPPAQQPGTPAPPQPDRPQQPGTQPWVPVSGPRPCPRRAAIAFTLEIPSGLDSDPIRLLGHRTVAQRACPGARVRRGRRRRGDPHREPAALRGAARRWRRLVRPPR